MAIGNYYPVSGTVVDQDLFLGTKAGNNNTVNYTAQTVANYLNTNSKVAIGGQISFRFDISPNIPKTISFSGGGGSGTPFSSITQLIVSGIDLSSTDITIFLNYLNGSEILLAQQNQPNLFGNYKITSYTQIGTSNFYTLGLQFIGGNGTITENTYYNLSSFVLSSGIDVPTLNQVLTAGNTSIIDAKVGNLYSYDNVNADYGIVQFYDSGVALKGASTNNLLFYNDDTGTVKFSNGPYAPMLNFAGVGNNVYTFQNANGTLAFLSDIPSLSGYVPYTGATGPVNLGAFDLTVNGLTIGRGSGTGATNTALGSSALLLSTTGYFNVAAGAFTLTNNTTGNRNSAFGYGALYGNLTGNLNVAIGSYSLFRSETGIANVSLGYSTLQANLIGSFNTGLGYRALFSNLADKNTAVGTEVMFSNTTGTFNTVVGQEALRANLAGSFNSIVGNFALLNAEASYVSALGRDAGRFSSTGNLNTASESIFIGYNSKSLNTSSVNEIVIGANAVGLGDNTIVLGSDSIVKTALIGNVGIGTKAPLNILDVVKNQAGSTRINIENTDAAGTSTLRFTKAGGAAAALFENASNQFTFQNATNSGTLRFQTTTAGGSTLTALTVDSNQNIEINNNLRVIGALYDSTNSPGTLGQVLASTVTGTDWVSLSEITGVDGTGTANYVSKWLDANTITNSLIYDNGTNVGIGTASPIRKLDVVGAIRTNDQFDSVKVLNSATISNIPADASLLLYAPTTTGNYGGIIGWAEGNVAASISAYDAGSGGALGLSLATGNNTSISERMRITNTGNVGIGTTSPENISNTTTLTLNGSSGGGAVSFQVGGVRTGLINGNDNYLTLQSYASRALSLGYNGNNTLVISIGNNVGIGTTAPNNKLSVSGGSIEIQSGAGKIGFNVNDAFTAYGGSIAQYGISRANGTDPVAISGYYGVSVFTDGAERMRILRAGSVGIGTTTPGTINSVAFSGVGLQVTSGSLGRGILEGSSQAELLLNDSGATANQRIKAITSDGGKIFLGAYDDNGTSRKQVTIDDSGNVGVGTTFPLARLQVRAPGTLSTDIALRVKDSADSADFMVVNGLGNVGIGTTNPTQKLQVNGNGLFGVAKIGNWAINPDFARFGHTSYDGATNFGFLQYSNGETYIEGATNNFYATTSNIFSTAGIERMRITSAGNVGIGLNNPSSLLEIAGSAPVLTMNRTSGSFTNTIDFKTGGSSVGSILSNAGNGEQRYSIGPSAGWGGYHTFYTDTSERMRIATNGNVGIGTSSPGSLLQVGPGTSNSPSAVASLGGAASGILSALSLVNINGADSPGYGTALDFHLNSAYSPTGRIATLAEASNPSASLAFYTYGTGFSEKMRITSVGNVGIGTASPDVKFQVQGGTIKATTGDYAFPSTGGAISMFQDNNDYGTIWSVKNYNGAWGNIAIAPLGGNVGIGTTSPAVKLNIASDGYNFRLSNNTNASGYNIGRNVTDGLLYLYGDQTGYNGFVFSGVDGERMRITSAGNVGIGTSSPTEKLTVSGGNVGISIDGTTSARTHYKRNGSYIWSTGLREGDTKFHIFDERSADRLVIDDSGNVGIGTSSPAASARLDVTSTTSGFLPPRMTNAQRTAISLPAVGLMVYCTDATEGLYIYKSTGWTFII